VLDHFKNGLQHLAIYLGVVFSHHFIWLVQTMLFSRLTKVRGKPNSPSSSSNTTGRFRPSPPDRSPVLRSRRRHQQAKPSKGIWRLHQSEPTSFYVCGLRTKTQLCQVLEHENWLKCRFLKSRFCVKKLCCFPFLTFVRRITIPSSSTRELHWREEPFSSIFFFSNCLKNFFLSFRHQCVDLTMSTI